jgi:protein-tyrosine phosphatase
MLRGYRTMTEEQAPSYREMFARLLAGRAPLVLSCTAGKDRTGVGTALVLTALGVPYETVRSDYLLSNGAPGMESLRSRLPAPLAGLPPEVIAPVIGVEGDFLDVALAEMRKRYGSVEAFMSKELGIGPDEVTALRQRMLE